MSLAVPTSSEFPTLAREGLVYLDTAATSQTVRPALEAMDLSYETYRASIHRGIYAIATEATDAYELARERVARFTGSTVDETIFTKNATEAINLVAYSWGRANVGAGDLVLIARSSTTRTSSPGRLLGWRRARLRVADARRAARSRLARRAAGAGPQARRRRAHLQRARHGQPDRGDRRPRPRGGRARARRRRPGRSAPRGRRARAAGRLLRLHGPQGLRADGHRRARRPPRASRRCRRSSAAGT